MSKAVSKAVSKAEAREAALLYVKLYAITHQFFNGGDILAMYRGTDDPHAQEDWRNRWGAVMQEGARRGWYVKSGREKPVASQSHTGYLTRWQSRLYKGEQAIQDETDRDKLHAIRNRFITREIDAMTALWAAYEVGLIARGVQGDEV